MLPCVLPALASYSLSISSTQPPGIPGLFDDDATLRALLAQADSCQALGSPMYHSLFTELANDYRDGGRTFALLAGRSAQPVHDALPLRLAGAIHRIVLMGREPRLARHYPSVGGKPGDDYGADVIGYMREHLDEIELGLASQVQTNEVGRSVVHLMLSHWITSLGIHEYDFWEVGASAGLNLNFDKFYACYGQLRMGDPTSELRFMGDWFATAPDVPRTAAQVVNKRGTDISPINVNNVEDELRLLSFVWPDQRARLQRTRTAIDIAKIYKPIVDQESADTWIERQLSRREPRATVVFHSIVWQYLGTSVQNRFRNALENAGTAATSSAPLVWARMEPAGPVADIQVTVWNGESEPVEYVLAEIGYHGQQMSWLGNPS
jgi:hypothetical protein